MGYPRQSLVCLNDTLYYHVIARCVRRAWLWGFDEYAERDYSHRKEWVIERLQCLTNVFAVNICAYAVMSNHYHLVLHVDQQRSAGFTACEIVERWSQLFTLPTAVKRWQAGEVYEAEATLALELIEHWRQRLIVSAQPTTFFPLAEQQAKLAASSMIQRGRDEAGTDRSASVLA